jgi:hypothetical protein
LLSAFLRFFSAFLLCGKLEYLTQRRRNAWLRLALLHRAVHRADVAVHDADALVGAAGVFLRPLAYLDPLDEQPSSGVSSSMAVYCFAFSTNVFTLAEAAFSFSSRASFSGICSSNAFCSTV